MYILAELVGPILNLRSSFHSCPAHCCCCLLSASQHTVMKTHFRLTLKLQRVRKGGATCQVPAIVIGKDKES